MNGYIYGRCSSLIQTYNNNHSIGIQFNLCIDYCIKNNFNIIGKEYDIKSGNDIYKLKIYDFIKNNKNINIIIADPSRLSRNKNDIINLLKLCKDNNIILHFVRDNLIINNIESELEMLRLIEIAEQEIIILKKRIKSTFELKKKLGSHFGRTPFGFDKYKLIDKKTNIVINKLKKNKLEQNIIHLIKKLYYGITLNQFNKMIKLICNKCIKYYSKLSVNDIVNLLNKNKIYNRNKLWNINSIKHIIYL